MTFPSPSHPQEKPDLEKLSRQIRASIVEMSHRSKAPHLGSCLSSVDILVTAYFHALSIDPKRPDDPTRDRFILSKGHGAAALYSTLAHRGFFPIQQLETYCADGGSLPEHPAPHSTPGVEAATGSLGHGLSLGIGMALAGRIQNQKYRVFALLSDGECNEGTVWEAALFAAAQRLDSLVSIIDFNKWQATGRSQEVLSLDPLASKWETFGWNVHEVDGHDLKALSRLLGKVPDGSGQPIAIIAHTIKGKGVSFMEDDNNWHYRIPTAEEVAAAWEELGIT